MIVAVGGDGSVTLQEADVLTRFHVATPPGSATDEALKRTGAGYVDESHAEAHVSVDWLRERARELSFDTTWWSGFDAMVKYAESKGWLNDDGTLTAHIEVRG